MIHDAFVSYVQSDKSVADAAVAALEAQGIRCWVSPRDLMPGTNYMGAISNAIRSSRLVVLVFSERTGDSNHVLREAEIAVNSGLPILPLRLDDVDPDSSLQYVLAGTYWLDAITEPMEQHLQSLAMAAHVLLESSRPPTELDPDGGGLQWLLR